MLKFLLHVCQDEEEFPDLATGGAAQRSTKSESTPAQAHTQPKLPKNLVRERALFDDCFCFGGPVLHTTCLQNLLNTNLCLYIDYSWITYQKTPPSTLCRHPSLLPPLFPREPRARGRRLWLLPWPLHRSTLKSAWNSRNYRYKL